MTPDFSTPDARAATIVAIVERIGKIPIDVRGEVAQRTYVRITAAKATNLSVAYVRKVAWNIFIDVLRAEKKRLNAEAEAERRPASRRDHKDEDAVQCIDDPFQSTNIMEEVDALPVQLRAVMHRSIAGDTPAEIATALHVPPGTVRWRLHQARLRVAKGLGLSYGKQDPRCRSPYRGSRRRHASRS